MVLASSLPPGPQTPRMVPVLLAFVAGAVDACTFLALAGLFVAQLTGSFVTIGVQIVRHDPAALIHLVALPLFFVAGAVIALLAQPSAIRGLALALAIETALLAGFMVTGLQAAPFASTSTPSALLASALGLLAMGVQSATVRLMLPGAPSTNVMTTNTTQLAIDAAQWLLAAAGTSARGSRAAEGRRVAALGGVMAAFFAGAVCGAVGFASLGFWSMLPPIVIVAALGIWAIRAA